MPMTINVGLSKKLGLPDYGSLGASCHIEFEAEHGLLDRDLEGFHQRVKNAFVAVRQAVQDELARGQQAKTVTPAPAGNAQTAGNNGDARSDVASANGHANGSTNGSRSPSSNGVPHQATAKQVEYLRQLSKQVPGLGIRRMEMLAERMFGKPLAVLSGFDASALIDTIKAVKAGQLDLDTVLEGAPA